MSPDAVRMAVTPPRSVGPRRPVGAATRDVGAVPAERSDCRLVSAWTRDPVLTPAPASLTFPWRFLIDVNARGQAWGHS